MGDRSDRLDPLLEDVVRTLRGPDDLAPGLEQRIMQEIRGMPRRRSTARRLLLGGAVALAAGLAGLMLATGRTPAPAGAQPVRFAIQADSAASVAVVGDFNEWDPSGTPLVREPDGSWSVTLSLPPGRYRFSFLLDGSTWRPDPGRPPVPDPDFDVPTSLVLVEGSTS